MGFVAGVLLAAKGGVSLAPLWAVLSSSMWITGTMSFAFVPEIAARSSIATIVLMTVAVNFRYAFYGFSMLERWRKIPFVQKAYLILMLTDENYALEVAASQSMDDKTHLKYCTVISALNHSYWVAGVTVGAVVVCLLGMAIDPDVIRRHTNGMEFAMVALFLVIFTDQIRSFVSHEK
jgi:4-azaleucine resistance transporter AzlC